jgi:hypothetical protein
VNFTEVLRLNMLSAKATEAGSNPDRSWPISVFAPSGPSYRIKTPNTGPMIMTRNFWGVTIEALQEVAKISIPIPSFNNHSDAPKCDPRLGRYRLISSDPTAVNSRVGDIYSMTWDPDLYALIGVLEAVPEWDDIFLAEWKAGRLGERGFSINFFGDAAEWRPNKRDLATTHEVYMEIDGVYSVDLVVNPAAGGRFLLPGCEPPYETIAEAELELFKYGGLCSLWTDDGDNEDGDSKNDGN